MEDIKSLGHDLYLVQGDLVCIMNGSVDLSTRAGHDKVMHMTGPDFQTREDKPYGPCTILYIYPDVDGRFGRLPRIELQSPKWLQQDIRDMLKRELPEYADEF